MGEVVRSYTYLENPLLSSWVLSKPAFISSFQAWEGPQAFDSGSQACWLLGMQGPKSSCRDLAQSPEANCTSWEHRSSCRSLFPFHPLTPRLPVSDWTTEPLLLSGIFQLMTPLSGLPMLAGLMCVCSCQRESFFSLLCHFYALKNEFLIVQEMNEGVFVTQTPHSTLPHPSYRSCSVWF